MGILRGERKNTNNKKRRVTYVALAILSAAGVFFVPSDAFGYSYSTPHYVGSLSDVDNSYGSGIHSYSNTAGREVQIVDTSGNSTFYNGMYFQAKEHFYVFNGNGGKTTAYGIHTDWDTNTTLATGFHEVSLDSLQSWTSLLKGDWGYIDSIAQQEYATVYAGSSSLQVISLGHILGDFGAYKPPSLDDQCDTYYNSGKYEQLGSPIITSDPPHAAITADQPVVGAGQTETLSTTVYDDTWNNTSHRESMLITGPNGYYNWVLGSADDSYWGNYNAMAWKSGGGPSGSLANTTCSGSGHAPWETLNDSVSFNTSGLASGTYTAHFYSMDWAHRGSPEVDASFNVDTVGLSANTTWVYTNQTPQLHASWYGDVTTGQRLGIYDSTVGQWIAWGGWGSSNLYANVEQGSATTHQYIAYLEDGSGTLMTSSGGVDISWNWPPTSISASPSNLYVTQASTVNGFVPGGTLDTGHRLLIWDNTAQANVVYGGWGSTAVSVNVIQNEPTTHQYQLYITDSAGHWVSGGASIDVAWSYAPISVSLSANPTTLPAGSATQLTASSSGTMLSTYEIQIYDQTTGKLLATGSPGSTALSLNYTNSVPTTDKFIAYVKYTNDGTTRATSNQVSVTWNQLTLTTAEVDHTAHWLQNLQAWNNEYSNQQRTLSTFWAGEQFIFKVQSNTTSGFSSGSVSFTPQYSSYVPLGAPLTVTLPLTWNSTDNAYEAKSSASDEPYFQYLLNGTYTATFTAKTTYGTVSQVQTSFIINGPWTDYWRQTQIW